MSILFTNEITTAVTRELERADSSVQIITAYCKKSAFINLEKHIRNTVNDKRVMIRFRLDDIVKGSTDFSILEHCRSNDWKVYLRFDLHAKTYIVDNKKGIVSSSNATNSGLGINRHSNLEMGILSEIDKSDIEKIDKLYEGSILVTNKIFQSLQNQYSKISINESRKTFRWNQDIMDLFKPSINALFTHEFPDTNKIDDGDYISFLDYEYTGNIDELKDCIRGSNAYLWLIDVLKKNENCLYFGSLTEKLHNTLVNDPKPYRRDVKVLLSNFLSIVHNLNMEEIEIDKPNYSQRVRLIKDNKKLL